MPVKFFGNQLIFITFFFFNQNKKKMNFITNLATQGLSLMLPMKIIIGS